MATPPIVVDNTSEECTHHFRLYDDDGNEVPLVAVDNQGNPLPSSALRSPNPRNPLKMYEGRAEYADRQPPWTPEGQDNWKGGRGQERLSKNSEKFRDSYQAGTARDGQIILGPQPVYVETDDDIQAFWPHCTTAGNPITYVEHDYETYPQPLVKFTNTNTSDPPKGLRVNLFVDWDTEYVSSFGNIFADIWVENGSEPNYLLNMSGWIDESELVKGAWHEYYIEFLNPVALGVTYNYYVGIRCNLQPYEWDYRTLKYLGSNRGNNPTMYYNAGDEITPDWTSIENPMHYVLDYDKGNTRTFYAEMEGNLFKIVFENGGTTRLFINGFQGLSTSGSSTTLVDTNRGGMAAWNTNEFAGAILLFREGTGSYHKDHFVQITSNTGNTFTFPKQNFNIGSNTLYSVVSTSVWKEITPIGDSFPSGYYPTGAFGINSAIYVCYGSAANIRRLGCYNNAGTWVWICNEESGNKATFMVSVPGIDASGNAKEMVWKALRQEGTVAYASSVNCHGGTGADLSFSADLQVGSIGDFTNGLGTIGENFDNLCVYKESGLIYEVWYNYDLAVPQYTASKLPLNELANLKDWRNGWANARVGPYNIWSIQDGLVSYYGNQLKGVGPDKDDGLPPGRRGKIAKLLSYAEDTYIALVTGYKQTAIMLNNGSGWHELYRAGGEFEEPEMYLQAIPGYHVDRLWFSNGWVSGWLPIDRDPYKYQAFFTKYTFYNFNHHSHVIMSDIDLGAYVTEKYFDGITVYVEPDPYSNTFKLKFSYRLVKFDDQFAHEFSETVNNTWTTQTSRDFTINETNPFITIRLELATLSNNKTPMIHSYVVNMLERLPHKDTFQITYRLMDKDPGLRGVIDDFTRMEKYNQLEAWSTQPGPIHIDAVTDLLDNKTLFLNPGHVRIIDVKTDGSGEETWICKSILVAK